MKRLLLLPLLLGLSSPVLAEVDIIKSEIRRCAREIEYGHSKPYTAGKEIALRLNRLYELKPSVIRKKIFTTKTKSDMFIEMTFVQGEMLTPEEETWSDEEKSQRWSCYLGHVGAARESAWSSVHSGLSEYLSPVLKAHFLSLPER